VTKTAKTNYVAKLDGVAVGTRSSPRAYTHAVIIQWNEAHYRDAAYNYKASKTDRSNFDYNTDIATQGINHPHHNIQSWRPDGDLEGIARAKAQIEGGFDAYVERLRQKAIEYFEAGRAKGGFKPGVAAWNGRRDLAEKEASKYRGRTAIANVWIVEAEVVAKPVKLKENKHHVYGPRA
jgi:hypothetical protein